MNVALNHAGQEPAERDQRHPVAVEILAVGNELLDGITQDTNTHWLCRQITALGAAVRRAVVVRDDTQAIAEEVRGARDRGTALLLVMGGLGPTADDLPLQGVAMAAGQPLEEHPDARAMVAARYEALYRDGAVATAEVTPDRLKMALIPRGAEPVHNPVGAAPGVLLHLGETTVVCLPGVPRELKAIFEGPLRPTLLSILGAGVAREREVLVASNDESALAPLIREVVALFPDLYIKSHARDFESGHGIRVTLSGRGTDLVRLDQRLDEAVRALRDRLPTS